MSRGRHRYVVAYDIRDPKRLRRVHKTVRAFGWPMQYSVFICDLDQMELVELRLALGAVMQHDVDSVALIDVGDPTERGRACFSFMGPPPLLPRSGPVII